MDPGKGSEAIQLHRTGAGSSHMRPPAQLQDSHLNAELPGSQQHTSCGTLSLSEPCQVANQHRTCCMALHLAALKHYCPPALQDL